MNAEVFSRSEALLGAERMLRLRTIRVIIFGVGGVGSVCAEALVRTGLTHLTIIDDDTVQPSNLNRQLMATQPVLGQPKVNVLRERLLSINPEAEIEARCERVNSQWLDEHSLDGYDFVIDAIDSVADKTDLIIRASRVRGAIRSNKRSNAKHEGLSCPSPQHSVAVWPLWSFRKYANRNLI